MIAAAVLSLVGIAGASPAQAAEATHTYYVSSTGSDAADGLSSATALRTVAAASKKAFHAGDVLLLQGGATFDGPLYLDASDEGLEVGSWGTGRATLTGHGSSAIFGYDTAALRIHDLNLVGDASAFTSKGGLSLYNDLSNRLSSITISNVDVQGFKNGIELGAAKAGAGYAHVVITGARAHANRDAGIVTYGPTFNAAAPSFAHTDVRVDHTTADGNLGNASDTTHNTGNGIVLGSVDTGTILNSRASGNGLLCKAPEGPVGIWTYDSRGIRIAYNVSSGNRTGGSADGDGFDLDQNVSSSVMENNSSGSNDGAGYLVYTGQSNSAQHDNIVRNNISTNDAKKNSWYGAITVAGHLAHTSVYGNKISTTGSASHAPAVAIKAGVSAVQVTRNSLTAATGYAVVTSPSFARSVVAFGTNTWSSAVQRVHWGTANYGSVPAWTKATSQS